MGVNLVLLLVVLLMMLLMFLTSLRKVLRLSISSIHSSYRLSDRKRASVLLFLWSLLLLFSSSFFWGLLGRSFWLFSLGLWLLSFSLCLLGLGLSLNLGISLLDFLLGDIHIGINLSLSLLLLIVLLLSSRGLLGLLLGIDNIVVINLEVSDCLVLVTALETVSLLAVIVVQEPLLLSLGSGSLLSEVLRAVGDLSGELWWNTSTSSGSWWSRNLGWWNWWWDNSLGSGNLVNWSSVSNSLTLGISNNILGEWTFLVVSLLLGEVILIMINGVWAVVVLSGSILKFVVILLIIMIINKFLF